MKISFVMFMVCFMSVSATSYSQSARVSIKMDQQRISDVFDAIQDQTTYSFWFESKDVDVDKRVSVDEKNQTVEKVLKKVLDDPNLDIAMKGDHIIISKRRDIDTEQEGGQSPKKKITGVIRDEIGEGVIGATISIKDTSQGTITDLDGAYSIEVDGDVTLVVSYIGYNKREIKTAGQTVINIDLQQDLKMLDEVVVVGYGTQRRGSITGSVSSVDNRDIVKAPVADLKSSLGGRLPGLRVMTRSGEPGSSAEVDVRGFGAALVIVDGVPSDFSQIDANEIENISVLKDASAAVYGVKAANGVILVTTKRGTKGAEATRINFNSTFSWQRPTIFPKMVNAPEFVEMTDEDRVNRGQAPLYGPEELAKWRAGGAGYESTDWYDEIIRSYSPQQQYNLNLRGGSKDLMYFASMGYMNQDGMWKSGSSNFNRFNVRANVDAKVTKNLTASLSLSGRKERNSRPYDDASFLMISLYRNYPTFSPYADPDGQYLGVTNVAHQNPVAITDKNVTGYKKTDRKVFEGSASLNYDAGDLVQGLSAKVMYYYRSRGVIDSEFRKEYNLYKYDAKQDIYDVAYIGNSPTQLKKKSDDDNYKLFQGSLNYSNVFAEKHDVSALLLVETRQGRNGWFDATREFIIGAIDELNTGSKDNIANGGTSSSEGNIGYVGRVNYAYDNRYLFEFGFRYDGSSNFPSGGRWGLFPSVSGGWRISEESFLKNKTSFLDDLKLRASWGRLGDDTFAEGVHRNQFLVGYKYPEGSYIFGDKVIPGLETKGLANPYITWYTADLYNAGFDATFLGGKFGAEVDFFYRKRKDLLGQRNVSLPTTAGAVLPQENLNSESDRGYELVLRHNNRLSNGIEYSVRGNVSYTKTKNEFIDRGNSLHQYDDWRNNTSSRWKNVKWGYKATDQFKSYEEIAQSPVQDGKGNTTLRPGDIKYLDYNGDGVIDANDEHVIGRGDKPEFMFGLDLYAAWKGIDVSVFFQGAANYNTYFIDDLTTPFFNGNTSYKAFTDRWHREDLYDPNSKWIPGKYPSTYANGLENNRKTSSFWLQNSNYLRVKDIQIGYTLPKKVLTRAGIQNLRVFVSGYNMFTFTSLEMLDPEAPNDTKGGYYPQQKVLSFGVNVTL